MGVLEGVHDAAALVLSTFLPRSRDACGSRNVSRVVLQVVTML